MAGLAGDPRYRLERPESLWGRLVSFLRRLSAGHP